MNDGVQLYDADTQNAALYQLQLMQETVHKHDGKQKETMYANS